MSKQNEKTKSYGQYLYSSFGAVARDSRGRLYPEAESPTRTAFQRDRDRIVHSGAFRRLKHKTQVFVYHEGDHYRTRLTHSLEVAQIGRSISRSLGLDEDLCEALALAHDLGHTPFGHAGEAVMHECMLAFEDDGFDHNVQSLRIVTDLERRYADFNGLNLTWETLEGLVKHNGPLNAADGQSTAPRAFSKYCQKQDLRLSTYASAEAQVAALSDDIAYNNHDIDDGLRAGLFEIADLESVPLVGVIFREVSDLYPGIERGRLIHEAVRRIISSMVTDAMTETRRRLAESGVETAEDIRQLGSPIVAFSSEMSDQDRALKAFLHKNMYRHELVTDATSKATQIVKDLFDLYIDDPKKLPSDWLGQLGNADPPKTARIICDYIAGMTDRFAIAEHRRWFGSSADQKTHANDFL